MKRFEKDIITLFIRRFSVFQSSRNVIFTFLLLLTVYLSTFSQIFRSSASTDDTQYFLTIDGNSELVAYCYGSGDGTAQNPYIINDYRKGLQSGSGIHIKNTDKYLILNHIFIYTSEYTGLSPYDVGLKLENCENVLIQESILERFDLGIIVSNCTSIEIKRTYLTNNFPNLRVEDGSQNISIHENYINGGTFGIQFLNIDPSHSIVFNNCLLDIQFAIDLFSSSAQVYSNYFYNCAETYRLLGSGHNTFTGSEENSIDNIEIFQAQLYAIGYQFFNNNSHFPLSYVTKTTSTSTTTASLTNSNSSPSNNNGDLMVFILLVILLLALLSLVYLKKINSLIKSKSIDRQWKVFQHEFHTQLNELQSLYSQYHYEDAFNLYRTLESNIESNLISKLTDFLGFTQKQIYLHLSIIQQKNHVQELINAAEYSYAYQTIQSLMEKIDQNSSPLQDPSLYQELQAQYKFLQNEKDQTHAEYSSKLSEILLLVQDQQYDQALNDFAHLQNKLEKWDFTDLLSVVKKQVQTLSNFRQTFQLDTKVSLTSYIEDLDDDFEEWNTNIGLHLGKKK
ncbi:hypothetical protein NEF87_005082 [Candidatus Lokiarchaeum ossiferum]|uniref:Periplasmic copper-binding protein NosD beta helix domain-containing protein n=1 Tax=Candidatus Lokiarchaeum ossiferum TaxID=2951803 RepID=A0ABY6HZ52_9ARCH|nr:hypothetical protein NEF87_005082 [Candidatus Lokiarchaeum sp. B-35]